MTERLFENIKASSSIVHPDDIRKFYRLDVVARFAQAKAEHPDYRKHQLCALIGVSDSYLKRVMKDLDIKSFYRHDIPVNTPKKKKSKKSKVENTPQADTPMEILKPKAKKPSGLVSDKTQKVCIAKGPPDDFEETFAKTCENLKS